MAKFKHTGKFVTLLSLYTIVKKKYFNLLYLFYKGELEEQRLYLAILDHNQNVDQK